MIKFRCDCEITDISVAGSSRMRQARVESFSHVLCVLGYTKPLSLHPHILCAASVLLRVSFTTCSVSLQILQLSRDDPGSDIACKRGYLEANASHGALKGCKSFIIGTGRKDARLIRCKYSELIYPYYQKY